MNYISDKRYLSLAEVAKRYGLSRLTIYSWVRKGKLQAVKLGNRWRVDLDTLEDFERQNISAPLE